MSDALTASEAAARLGVKRATLYAYVSRGLLERTVALDGRTSLFDPSQVESLRKGRRRVARGELTTVISSSITRVGESGHTYRDVSVAEIIKKHWSFERVADLIWQSDNGKWGLTEDTASRVRSVQLAMPPETPAIDRIRVSVSIVSALDSLRYAQSVGSFAGAGRQMIQAMVVGLNVGSPGVDASRLGVASGLWEALAGAFSSGLDEEQIRAFEIALILLADHGLAASTFGVRVAASTRADPYSAVAAGLGILGGTLHGSAPLTAARFFERAHLVGAKVAVVERLDSGERIPGFGHTIYRETDPRERILMRAVEAAWPDAERLDTLDCVRQLATERLDLPTNIDFALGAMAWLGGFTEFSIAVFGIARTVGWVAHAIEEYDEPPTRFRPTARYVANHGDSNDPELI